MRPMLDPCGQKPCPQTVRPVPCTGPSPALLPVLMRCQPELLPRLVTYYTELQGLPRRVRRALQRQWRLSLGAVALMLALGQSPLAAATIPVQGGCTLVAAIRAANTDRNHGGCPAGRGADTIVLPQGSTQTLTSVQNSDYGPTGLPVIRSEITLSGRGSTLVRANGAPEFRILAVNSTGKLTLTETTVSGGRIEDVHPNKGGGVLNAGGTLTVLKSTISGNSTYNTGGGIENLNGTVTITNSTISDNDAIWEQGGGVNNSGGTVTITNSTISGNSAYDFGCGVHNRDGGTVTITNSTISDNRTGDGSGGGVFNWGGGTVTITNSTISGNRAWGEGGSGGGVWNGGTMTVTNSTISANQITGPGGGVLNQVGGTMTITNSTISGNDTKETELSYGAGGVWNGGTLTLARTLVAGNTASTSTTVITSEIANRGTIVVDNHNLFGVDGNDGVEGFSPGSTDVVPDAGVLLSDILDPTLADHGGSTLTHALVPGSPAINAGPSTCPVPGGGLLQRDQRGVQRPQEGACDIGAYEFLPVVQCGGHVATLVGSAQDDVLVGTSGNDVIRALEGNDVVDGKGGNDIICGGIGNDTLRGGPGQDQLFGGEGNDTLEGGSGRDICDGGEGQDTHAGGCERLINIP